MCYEVGENRGSGEIGELETMLSDKITFSKIQRSSFKDITQRYAKSMYKLCWYDLATVCIDDDDDVEWWKTVCNFGTRLGFFAIEIFKVI